LPAACVKSVFIAGKIVLVCLVHRTPGLATATAGQKQSEYDNAGQIKKAFSHRSPLGSGYDLNWLVPAIVARLCALALASCCMVSPNAPELVASASPRQECRVKLIADFLQHIGIGLHRLELNGELLSRFES
jgi:hypothetical protein